MNATSIGTLKDLLDRRRLTMDELLAWAPAIAAELSALHERGQVHGAVAAGSIRIEGRSAHLGPGAAGQAAGEQASSEQASSEQPRDIVQFAALLRQMLDSVQVESDAARAQWRALGRIAATNSRAASGSRMKKVASALRLLRFARGNEAPEPVEPPAPRRNCRVLMLVREVPPARPIPPGAGAKPLHVLVLLASAAAVAIIGGILFLLFR